MRKGTAILRMLAILFLLIGFASVDICSAKEKKAVSKKADKKMVVKEGNKVKVQYTGKLEDGTIFDKSKEAEPLEFTMGGGEIISGFEKAVEGMKLNEEKQAKIKAKDAYGERNEDLIRRFARSSLPPDFKPEKGMVIQLQDASARQILGRIIDVAEEDIAIDLNHPLAGKDLIFDINVVGIGQE